MFRKASPRHLLKVVRGTTLASGALMIFFAYFVVSRFKGVVQANLTIVGIFDMPIFVIAIVYGLLWRRANWQGAIGGYVVGATAGLCCYKYFSGNPDLSAYPIVHTLLGQDIVWAQWAKSLATLASTSAALIATPLVSVLFPKQKVTSEGRRILDAFKSAVTSASGEEIHLMPTSGAGKLGLVLMALGFLLFLFGVLSGSVAFALASQFAVGGMLVFFAGGLVRVYTD